MRTIAQRHIAPKAWAREVLQNFTIGTERDGMRITLQHRDFHSTFATLDIESAHATTDSQAMRDLRDIVSALRTAALSLRAAKPRKNRK